jgi:hypothetical protein
MRRDLMAPEPEGSISTIVALVSQRLDAIVDQVSGLRAELKNDYLRKDIADARYQNLESKILAVTDLVEEIRKDADAVVERQHRDRTLFRSALVFPVITGLMLLLAALALGGIK